MGREIGKSLNYVEAVEYRIRTNATREAKK